LLPIQSLDILDVTTLDENSEAGDSLPHLLRRLWVHVLRKRRLRVLLLLGFSTFVAILEVVTIASVIPFIGILDDPDRVFNQKTIHQLASSVGIRQADELVIPLTIVFICFIALSAFCRALFVWMSTRLGIFCGSEMSTGVFERALSQPYIRHLNRNSGEIISGAVLKVNQVISYVIIPSLSIVMAIMVLIFVSVGMLIINPVLSIITALIFGVSYILIGQLSQKRIRKNSRQLSILQTDIIKKAQEGLGAIRDILLNGTQDHFVGLYRKTDRNLRVAQANTFLLASTPRYAMEALGMTVIVIMAYNLTSTAEGLSGALPELGVLAYGAFRVLPAVHQVYGSWTLVAGERDSLKDVLEILDQPILLSTNSAIHSFEDSSDILAQNIGFRYAEQEQDVLTDVSLRVRKGAHLGLVGRTGCGKSTFLDLIMGLLEPTRGMLLVDGEVIDSGRGTAWRSQVVQVSQDVFIADTTLAGNVAFGVPANQVDRERLQTAYRLAQLVDEDIQQRYIESTETVGDRGSRLSAGQRQRVGIARAIYRGGSLLVLDEATNAIDEATEQAILEGIRREFPQMTIISVSHRMTSLMTCDEIAVMSMGEIVTSGSYDSLVSTSSEFRELMKQER
jgi:ABC-type multidrug transport system fused ATPase/permease subunit